VCGVLTTRRVSVPEKQDIRPWLGKRDVCRQPDTANRWIAMVLVRERDGNLLIGKSQRGTQREGSLYDRIQRVNPLRIRDQQDCGFERSPVV
jgi:hypothetical protein